MRADKTFYEEFSPSWANLVLPNSSTPPLHEIGKDVERLCIAMDYANDYLHKCQLFLEKSSPESIAETEEWYDTLLLHYESFPMSREIFIPLVVKKRNTIIRAYVHYCRYLLACNAKYAILTKSAGIQLPALIDFEPVELSPATPPAPQQPERPLHHVKQSELVYAVREVLDEEDFLHLAGNGTVVRDKLMTTFLNEHGKQFNTKSLLDQIGKPVVNPPELLEEIKSLIRTILPHKRGKKGQKEN